MSTTKQTRARFKVGDWVTFPYGTKNVFAQVIEARGPLGFKRRQLYRIRIAREGEEPDTFEISEDDAQAASPPDAAVIEKYLTGGGLVAILRSNLGGGRNQPRAWLTFAPRGEITHTFDAERGVIGGAVVPFFALHEGKVFTGKTDEVLSLLASFGLGLTKAEEVLRAIGTAP